MKDSGVEWIGEIPKDWNVKRLKYALNKKKEIIDEYNNEPILSLTMNGVILRDLINIKGKMPATFDGYQKIDRNCLLACLFDIDVTPRCIGIAYESGLTSPAYTQFKVNEEYNLEFMNYYLLFLDNDKILVPLAKSLRNTIKSEDFLNLKFCIPNLKTQKIIVNKIKKDILNIDELIFKTKQSIEELKRYKQSLITEVVTKGLDKNVEMKDSGIEWIGEIPKDWEVKKLKFICVESKEYLSNKEDKDLEFNYIDIGSVSYDKGIIKNEKLKFINAPSRARKIINNEDVIISSVRTYLKAITVIENLSEFTVVSTGFIVLKTTNNTNYEYLSYLLKSNFFTSKVQSLSEGITYPAIVTSKLMNIKVPIPALNEQIKLKNYLNLRTEKIDLLIEKKMNLIKEYESYKKSLIYEYVTGKKEVEEEVE